MGMMNVIEYIANEQWKDQVVIYTDSTYVYNGVMKKVGKQANKNGDLWGKVKLLVQNNPNIQYIWTQGHVGQKWNECADELCRKMYQKSPIHDIGYIGNKYEPTVKYGSTTKSVTAKQYLQEKYLPTTRQEERELWYKCSDWARTITQIMEEYKKS